MDKVQMKPGTVIGNVNVLDITRATEDTLSAIQKIGSVNILIYSRETAHFVPLLSLGNLNAMVEVQTTPRVTVGNLVISKESVREGIEPASYVAVGNVMVEPDVSAADFEKIVESLAVVGQLVYPSTVAGVLHSRLMQLVGNSVAYPANGRVMKASVNLDEGFLAALEEGTELVVLGSLRVPQVLPAELLERKIASLYVLGSVRCPEENQAAIRARLTGGIERMVVIPSGHMLVEKDLVLDKATLDALPGSKLFCLAGVQIGSDVGEDQLDARLERLVANDLVLCPKALSGVLSHKCNLLETKAVFYEETLWLINGEEHLVASRFEYLEGKATLVVNGELTIDTEVEPKMLAERLVSVHNFGEIVCSTAQRGALDARMGLNEGEIQDSAAIEEPWGENTIGNVNHLVL